MKKKFEVLKILNRKWIIIFVSSVFFLSIIFGLSTRENPKINIAAQELIKLAEGIQQFYRNRPGYWGLNTAMVIKNGIAQNSILKKDKLLNILEKEIAVGQGAEGNVVMPGMRSFDIAYKSLNKKECVSLATYKFTEQQSLGLLTISIINEKNNVEFSWGGENRIPIHKSAAKEQCTDDSTLIWSFE